MFLSKSHLDMSYVHIPQRVYFTLLQKNKLYNSWQVTVICFVKKLCQFANDVATKN